jgi:hypothetical protein
MSPGSSPASGSCSLPELGAHDATNEFADVPNIILAGTLFLRSSDYEALGRLASGHPSSSGRFDDEKVREVTAGEHRHLILQALCRGVVRKCLGEGCPPARAYIIASRKSGIAEELPHIFPGARILPWRPVKKALRGKVAEAVQFITAQLASDPTSVVTFREVMAHLGWRDRKEFQRRIRKHDDFRAALVDAGIEEWGKGRWPKGFRLFGTRFLTDGQTPPGCEFGVDGPQTIDTGLVDEVGASIMRGPDPSGPSTK